VIIEYNGKRPQIAEGVFIAPNAVIIGDVIIEKGASIWFGTVIRGDSNRIIICEGANVQDNSVVHSSELNPPTYIGPNVTIGHGVMMEGCRIERGALIGMNSVVLGDAVVGEEALVAAGSVVGVGAQIPARHLVAGAPAVVKKPLSGGALKSVEHSAPEYFHLRDQYLKQGAGLNYEPTEVKVTEESQS
jgi:carbonic anhydrase/acetyltransferase-like protein (isoleucine patch superfamily)